MSSQPAPEVADPNRALADRARQLARLAPSASLDRRAWGCCAVALSATNTLAAARAALADIREPEVQAAARNYLDDLARKR